MKTVIAGTVLFITSVSLMSLFIWAFMEGQEVYWKIYATVGGVIVLFGIMIWSISVLKEKFKL